MCGGCLCDLGSQLGMYPDNVEKDATPPVATREQLARGMGGIHKVSGNVNEPAILIEARTSNSKLAVKK